MKLFLDTAHLEHIKEIASWGILDGITTNPTLIAREGRVNVEKHVRTICKLVPGPVSVEVVSSDLKGMLKEAREYSTWAENVVVKVPMMPDGLRAIETLRQEGIRTNVTLIFSANQALLAAKAGASLVSPFIGRLDDVGEQGMMVTQEIMNIFDNYDFETEILVASVRHPRHVSEAAVLGAHIATLPYEVFQQLIHHPLTNSGLHKFLTDWKKRK